LQGNDKPVLVYSTFPSTEVAEAVGRDLVEGRLAACVNIIPGMTSIYRWQGSLCRDAEVVMIIKTTGARVDDVLGGVRARHPYDNPALLVLPVEGGSAEYLDWLRRETG
jgi:periplasmic divalent cation tolerance protein